MDVGLFGDLRTARINDDQFETAGLLTEQIVEELVRRRPAAVLTHDEAAPGLGRGSSGDFGAVGEFQRVHVREVARDRAFATVVGRAEVTRKTHDGRTRFLGVAAVKEHAVGTVLRLHLVEIFGDYLDRFIPRNTNPARIRTPLGVHAFHRVKQTVRVVKALQRGKSL